MAQDAELKLRVSLDLGFFRQQLAGLGQVAAGYNMPINVKFDRSVITKELRNLERALGKKKINIELNLLGGLTKDQLERIQGRLEALSKTKKVEIPVSIKNGATGKDADKVVASIKERLAQNQQIKQGGGKLRIEASVKPSITNEDIAVFKKAVKDKLSKIGALEIPTKLDAPKVEDLLKALQKNINRQKPLLVKTSIKPSILSADVKAFKKAVESKLSGITVKINAELETIGGGKTKAQIEKEVLAGLERIQQMGAERMGGGVTEPARRESLRQSLQGRDIGELKDIGRQLGVANVGKFRNTQNLIERIVTEASIEMITKYLDPQAVMRNPDRSGLNKVLDTFARGLFNMLGMDVASMRQQAAQRRALPGVNFPATVPSRPVSIGPSSTGRALSAGAGPAGMIGAAQAPVGLLPSMSGRSQTQAIVEALIAQQGPRMLPSGGGALVDTKRIYAELQKNLDNALRRMFTVLEVSVFETGAGLKDGLDTFAYLAQALKDAEARTKQSRIAEEVDSLISRIETALRLAAARVNIRQVQIGIGASMQGALPSARVAGLLPAGVGREPSRYAMGGESREQMMARRTAEAYARSALRGMDVMGGGAGRPPSPYSYAYRSARPTSAIIPYAQPGAIVPSPVAGEGGMGGFGGMGGGDFRNLMGLGSSATPIDLSILQQSRVPLTGAIKELGQEFGFAIQQVLLFGTAYKALAFFTNLPGEAFNAAKALATYKNQLQAVTSESGTFERSFAFVDNLSQRFNVPLESARQGFVKLYASMEPAGFGPAQIENLFEGISKATAAFGLSSDKVDRVNYAFAQMASKGQIMSEELKGQLGDVLPGALALFAEAAQMSIPEFSKAMEDGAFKGKAMQQVLDNVAVLMNNKFGPAAQNASKTLQGALNQIQNNLKLMYESMSPIVDQFAAAFGPQINSLVKDITTAVNVLTGSFVKGSDAVGTLSPRAQALYSVFQQMGPSVLAAGQNIGSFVSSLQILISPLMASLKGMLDFISLPVVARVGLYATVVASLNAAFQLLARTGIVQATFAMIRFLATLNIAQVNVYIAGIRTVIAVLGSMVTAANIAKIAVLGLKVAFGGLIVGGILVGLDLLAQRLLNVGNSAESSKQKVQQFAQELDQIAGSVDVENATKKYMEANTELAIARKENQKALSELEAAKLRQATTLPGEPGGGIVDIANAERKASETYAKVIAATTKLRQARQTRSTAVRLQEEERTRTQQQLKPIDLSAGEDKKDNALKKAQQDAEQAAKQEQQRRIELAGLQNDMDKIGFDYRMGLSDAQFEHEKQLIDELNNYELSGLNDRHARQLKFAQDLKKVQLNAIDAIRKARQKVDEAQLNVVTARRSAQAAGGGGGINSGPIIGGFTPAQLSSATAAASKFTGIANMCSESVKAFYKSLGISLPGVTAWADTVRNAGTTMKDWSKLAPGDIVATGKPGDTPHVGVYTGGQNVFHQSRSRGLRAGNYPDLDYFKQGGYFVRPSAGIKQSSASFSMDTKAQKESFDLIKEQAKASAQTALQQLEIQNALKIAYVQTASTIKANIDNIFPVEKQRLDLSLQQMRHNLLMQGMPQEYIDYEEKRAAATEEAAMAVNVMKDSLSGAKAELKVYNDAVAGGAKLSIDQQANVTRLTGSIAALEEGLANAAKQQREYNIASLESAIATMKQADALKAMEEVSGRINDAVTGVTDTYKSLFKEIAMGEDSVEALKKAQKALADQFLTMVFDMAMKPVEESMKNSLAKMFGVPTEKEKREESIKKMEEQLTQLKRIENNTAIAAGKAPASGATATPAVPGQMTAAGTSGGFLTGTAALQTLPFNGQTGGMLQNLPFPAGDTGFLSSIGINSEEMKASMSESVTAFSDQLGKFDASIADSAFAVDEAGTVMSKDGPAGKKWQESLGQVVGGLGMAAGAVMGIVAGINQIKEGGTSNVLGGIGMIASMAGSLLGNFGGLFGGGGGASSIVQGTDIPIAQMPAGMQFANGGVAFGGFRAFANGGTVSGPTLGLVGEGKYNEAIVPLPDGRSIPVQLGGRSARDLMGNGAPGMPQAPSLSMKFETTKINGVEYVSREQLEQAMAETRRASIAGGAQRGMSMTLDKIKQSPSTRSSIGIR